MTLTTRVSYPITGELFPVHFNIYVSFPCFVSSKLQLNLHLRQATISLKTAAYSLKIFIIASRVCPHRIQRLGWRVQLVANPEISDAVLNDILGFWNPLGCIVDCGNRASIPPPSDFGATQVVYLDCQRGLFGNKANYVSHDSAATVSLCVRELMSLGLVNFAYVGHFGRQYWSEDRRRQFVDIIAAHGLRHIEFAQDAPTVELEFRRGLETFLSKLPKPCSLLAVNDEIAEMVVVAANRLGIHIPDELALVSIDNNPDVCESLSPTLSSADVDFYRSGQLAAELLDRIVRGKRRSSESATFGPTRIIRRASSRPLADHTIAMMLEHIRKTPFTRSRPAMWPSSAKDHGVTQRSDSER